MVAGVATRARPSMRVVDLASPGTHTHYELGGPTDRAIFRLATF